MPKKETRKTAQQMSPINPQWPQQTFMSSLPAKLPRSAPERIYEQALLFNYAEQLLTSESISRIQASMESSKRPLMGGIIPATVLTAFSIELAFKCVIQIERPGTRLRTHELDKLFDKISAKGQDRIERLYNKALDEVPFFVELKKRGIPLPKLRTHLKETGQAFQQWRYTFDYKDAGDMPSPLCADVTLAYVLELKPDWSHIKMGIGTPPRFQVRSRPKPHVAPLGYWAENTR
jgi:hypothetical protein